MIKINEVLIKDNTQKTKPRKGHVFIEKRSNQKHSTPKGSNFYRKPPYIEKNSTPKGAYNHGKILFL
ncbi:hypothetical protein EGI26_07110 [Lacihabitans sp. CCS-44]|nr:hypothetical protein [Lacihabitans sp. CCS-44]